jgi:hypothetical protein
MVGILLILNATDLLIGLGLAVFMVVILRSLPTILPYFNRSGVLLILGIGILLGILLIYAEFLVIRFWGMQTIGRVESVFQPRFDNQYQISFNDHTGSRITFTTGRFGPRYAVGDMVTVAYLPDDQGGLFVALIVRPLLPDDLPIVITFSVITLIGIGLVRLGWQRRKIRSESLK